MTGAGTAPTQITYAVHLRKSPTQFTYANPPTRHLKPTGYETYGLALGKIAFRIFHLGKVRGRSHFPACVHPPSPLTAVGAVAGAAFCWGGGADSPPLIGA